MTTGEGGMIVTDDAGWDALFRSLRNQGRDVFDGLARSTARLGYNYRLDEMSAALGLAQVARLDEILARPRARGRLVHASACRASSGVEPPPCRALDHAHELVRLRRPPRDLAAIRDARDPRARGRAASRRGRTFRRSTCSRSTASDFGFRSPATSR